MINLKELSDRELQQKHTDINSALDMMNIEISEVSVNYTKIAQKRRVKPNLLIRATKRLDNLKLADGLLDEYLQFVLDEKKQRAIIKEAEFEEREIAKKRNTLLDYLKEEFGSIYDPDIIAYGGQMAKKYCPGNGELGQKLQAVKEFKSYSGLGLKESKDFMDVAWDYINTH